MAVQLEGHGGGSESDDVASASLLPLSESESGRLEQDQSETMSIVFDSDAESDTSGSVFDSLTEKDSDSEETVLPMDEAPSEFDGRFQPDDSEIGFESESEPAANAFDDGDADDLLSWERGVRNAKGTIYMGAEAMRKADAVPQPGTAMRLIGPLDFAEFYSPPRVSEHAAARGLRTYYNLSLDLLTGWDFDVPFLRALSLDLLARLQVLFLMLSPPWTAFSSLQHLRNYKERTKEAVDAEVAQGMVYLEHSMDCAKQQIALDQFFGFEHPASATSWGTTPVQEIMHLQGVHCVVFDQCMLGLASPASGTPMRKRTRIMTNSVQLVQRLQHCKCDNLHEHQTIQGTECGIRRSVWAQRYPDGLSNLIAEACLAERRALMKRCFNL
jgi:hypothetical protein